MKKLLMLLIPALIFFRCSENNVKPQAPQTPLQQATTSAQPGVKTLSTAANTLYVSTTGNDAGTGSAASPYKTLLYAVTKAPANLGYTIQLAAGTFIENGLIEVPLGVSIVGAGSAQTILRAASSFYYHPATPGYATDKFLISMTAAAQSNGNQTLSNFSIDGDTKQLHGGIYVKFRDNVIIDNVKVSNTNFTGIWFWDVRDSKITNSQIVNCSWGSTSYSSGALNLGNITRVEIAQLDVNESTGYGIKAIGPSPNNILSSKIHDSHISVNPVGLWNSGSAPNIAIELWSVNLVGNEIYNTYVDNTISLVNNTGIASTGVQTIRVHNNTIDMDTRAHGAGYSIELTINDAEIDHNYFIKGTQGIANWATSMKNWSIHHNTFYAIQGIYPGEVVRSQSNGLHNVKLYNNTIEFASTKTMNVVGLYGGASDNVDIKNNLFIDNNTGYSYYPNQLVHLENAATLSTLTVQNNSFFHLPVGSVPGTYANNLTIDPQITVSGARPDPYYMPKAGSPLINAGLNVGFTFVGSAPEIGALEYGAVGNISPQVTITGPANNAAFVVGSSVTITANATDSDGTISKVEFYAGATLLGQSTTSPYGFTWTNVPAGNYSLTTKATDNQGATTVSLAVNITVSNANLPPQVTLTGPSNNATFTTGAAVTLTANATDADGSITKVEFFNGAIKLGEDLTSPFSLVWTATVGTSVISAKATDNSGAITTSNAASVTVSNSAFAYLGLDSSVATLSGKMITGLDASAQSGNFFYVAPGNGTNYSIPPPGSATFNVQIPKTGNYVIWAKVKTPTATNQGFEIYNGKGHWFTWQAGVHTAWTWVKMTDTGATAQFAFSLGANQFQVAWYNDNAQVDQVLVTDDLSYVPQ